VLSSIDSGERREFIFSVMGSDPPWEARAAFALSCLRRRAAAADMMVDSSMGYGWMDGWMEDV